MYCLAATNMSGYFTHRRRHERYVVLPSLLALALLVRVATVVFLNITPQSDYLQYQSIALNFLSGHGFLDAMGNYAMYSIGYPLFIVTPAFFISDNSLLVVQIINSILGTISTAIVFFIAKEVGATAAGRALATFLFALYVPSWVYAEYLAKENLTTPLILLVLLCALYLLRGISIRICAACGFVFGILAIAGNSALSLLLPLSFAIWLSSSTTMKKLSGMLILILCGLIVTTPWIARNYYVVGSATLNSNGGFNLYIGNNPLADGYFMSIADTPRGKSWHDLRLNGEIYASRTLKRDALAWIWENPQRFVTLSIRKGIAFWTPPIHSDSIDNSFLNNLARGVWLSQYIFVLLMSLAGLAFSRKFWSKEVFVLTLAIMSYLAVHMLFYVVYRYREPIMPILCILAALSCDMLCNSLSRHMSWSDRCRKMFLGLRRRN